MSANYQTSPAYYAQCSSNWFNPYASESQLYNPHTAQSYGYQVSPYNITQTNVLSLDDYTDDSDSEPETAPAKPILENKVATVELASSKSQRNSQGSDGELSASTLEPSDSDSSDSDLERLESLNRIASMREAMRFDVVISTPVEASPSFSIQSLLQFRHAVPFSDGLEAYPLKAEEVETQPQTQEVKKQPETRTDRLSACIWRSEMKAPKSPKAAVPEDLLQVSEGSWQAKQMARRQAATELELRSDEDIIRAMKSILNKLTVEKFTPLFEKLVSCGIRTTVHLEALVNEVFQKATMQHHFIDMYADLCVRLQARFVEHPIIDDQKMSFKSILLRGSQAFFETNMKMDEAELIQLEELDEEDRIRQQRKYKMQVIGNIKFMGALLVRQMLASKVLFAISDELLQDPTPESLESLATLLSVVGPKFDNSQWSAHSLLVDVFQKVQDMVKDPKLNCRVKFLLKDVLELRAAGWQERKPKQVAGPSTLKEVADTQAADHEASSPANGASSPSSWRTLPPNAGAVKGAPQPAPVKVEKCKFGRRCTRVTCWHQHPTGRLIDEATEATTKQDMINSLSSTKCPWADKSKVEHTPKQSRGKTFDKEPWRNELSGALRELRMSHDVQEALLHVWAVFVPVSQQGDEVCEMLSHMVEEGAAANRIVYFEFVAGLVGNGHWKVSSVQKGLQSFLEDICPDLKHDIPALPSILWDELHPALAPVVGKECSAT